MIIIMNMAFGMIFRCMLMCGDDDDGYPAYNPSLQRYIPSFMDMDNLLFSSLFLIRLTHLLCTGFKTTSLNFPIYLINLKREICIAVSVFCNLRRNVLSDNPFFISLLLVQLSLQNFFNDLSGIHSRVVKLKGSLV